MSVIVSSEENRKAYAERKNYVLDLLENAKNYYLQDENEENVQVFEKLANDLKNGEFSIVVVGEFSAGKSTLLNALMGQRILPSFSNETTATINFLRHSDKAIDGEVGKVFYSNGESKNIEDISLENIQKYVSTKGDDVAKKVEHLDLYLDSDFLKDGVTLVDSPGLNGIADGHREITEAQILKSHASIFLFNSDHPGSKTDFEFLYDLQNKVKTIIFVLNKIDTIKSDENESPESVIETLKKTYKEKFPEANSVPEIWPVAAYPALVARNAEPLEYHGKVNRTTEEKEKLEQKSRLKAFEDRLTSFLTCGEKTKQQLLSPVDKVLTLAVDSRENYENEKRMLEQSVDTTEIENQIEHIKETIEGLNRQISGTRNDVTGKIRESLRDTKEELTAKMEKLKENKLNEINKFDNGEDLIAYLQKFEKFFISKVQKIVSNQEEDLQDKIISVIKLQYTSQADVIESRISNKENIEIKFKVAEHLDSNEKILKVGLEEMDKEIENCKKDLKELEGIADKAEEQYYRNEKVKNKMDDLKNNIQTLQENKNIIENQILPSVERYTQQINEKVERGGIFGTVIDVFFGKKDITSYKSVTDSSEYDKAKQKQDDFKKEVTKQIEAKEKELKEIEDENKDVSLDYSEQVQIKTMAAVNKKREELNQLIQKNTENIEKNYQKQIKKIKRTLTDYCDYIADELEKQVKGTLRNLEQNYIDIVLDIVESTLKKTLSNKKKQLERLEKQLNASEKDRNKRIEILDIKVTAINDLIEKASDLQTDLLSIPIDQIKCEAI